MAQKSTYVPLRIQFNKAEEKKGEVK